MSVEKNILDKILGAPNDYYVIFYIPECPYCQSALELLRKNDVNYKGYLIDSIPGKMPTLLEVLNNNADVLNFNPLHKTKPIIFYQNKFLGGKSELQTFFDQFMENY